MTHPAGPSALKRIVSRRLGRSPSGSVGDLRRVTPLSREFGFDRGAATAGRSELRA
jgi:hypothetical protein